MSPDKRRRNGTRRIGNSRDVCPTCNGFAHTARLRALAILAKRYPEEYARIRLEVEADLYPAVIARWSAEHPEVIALAEANAILSAEVDDTLRALAEGLGVEP